MQETVDGRATGVIGLRCRGTAAENLMISAMGCLSCRFKSAKDFVKKGQDQAVIQVTMWNTGAEAYLPEQLGRTFTIERRISRTGGNVFCVKNSAGAAVSGCL